MARPRIVIDEAELVKLAAIDCTVDEMAAFLGASRRTLYRRFGTLITKGRDLGNCSIKRKLWKLGMGGNARVLMFLAKNRCGYKDNPNVADKGDVAELKQAILDRRSRNGAPRRADR